MFAEKSIVGGANPETEAFGFWMVPANCDVSSPQEWRRVSPHEEHIAVHMSILEAFTKKVTETTRNFSGRNSPTKQRKSFGWFNACLDLTFSRSAHVPQSG